MPVHIYSRDSLRADYLRAAAGLLLTALPLILVRPHWIVGLLLGAMALLFLLFLLRTAQRQVTTMHVDDNGIRAEGPMGKAVAWADLSDLRLRYFSTRRDKQKGWMHLTLKGAGKTLKVESSIAGFEDIVDRAVDAAKAKGLRLEPTTLNNLAALGFDAPGDPVTGDPGAGG
ncbi:hypothetical protein [Inquilinus sp. CAU 1745]|uniref:hypothetical protein n=1 Tax=Inquilinus sp. CAU 1745 TaxID=3140369 RepID=UPI00325B56EB